MGCDGQVLVFHDLVGLTLGHVPSFVKQTANLKENVEQALRAYIDRTKSAPAQLTSDRGESATLKVLSAGPIAEGP